MKKINVISLCFSFLLFSVFKTAFAVDVQISQLTDTCDDLTDLDYEAKGLFLNIVGKL